MNIKKFFGKKKQPKLPILPGKNIIVIFEQKFMGGGRSTEPVSHYCIAKIEDNETPKEAALRRIEEVSKALNSGSEGHWQIKLTAFTDEPVPITVIPYDDTESL